MASPKSGTAGNPVAPSEPTAAAEAIDDVSGAKSEASGEAKERVRPTFTVDPAKTSWIELVLVDENDEGIPGEPFEVETPDGSVCAGVTDPDGFARVDHIDPGTCIITFPRLDKDAWAPA